MKKPTLIPLTLFVLGAVLFLIQLWFSCWDAETFSKIMVTDVILFAVSFVVAFLVKENQAAKKMNKDNELE